MFSPRLSAPALPFSFSPLARKLVVDGNGRSRGPGWWPPRQGDLLSRLVSRVDARSCIRCAGPGASGELSRCGPKTRARRRWIRADSQQRAAGRAVREGVPPRLRAARCEPPGGKGRRGAPRTRAWRARAQAGRPLCAISAGSHPALTRRGRDSAATPSALQPPPAPLPESAR